MLRKHEDHRRCTRCGAAPAAWTSAPLAGEPCDAGEPTVGEPVASDLVPAQTQSSSGLFSTSPPGGGACDVNPELRVRY